MKASIQCRARAALEPRNGRTLTRLLHRPRPYIRRPNITLHASREMLHKYRIRMRIEEARAWRRERVILLEHAVVQGRPVARVRQESLERAAHHAPNTRVRRNALLGHETEHTQGAKHRDERENVCEGEKALPEPILAVTCAKMCVKYPTDSKPLTRRKSSTRSNAKRIASSLRQTSDRAPCAGAYVHVGHKYQSSEQASRRRARALVPNTRLCSGTPL